MKNAYTQQRVKRSTWRREVLFNMVVRQLTSFYQNKFLKEENVNVKKSNNFKKEKCRGTFNKSLGKKMKFFKIKIRKKSLTTTIFLT